MKKINFKKPLLVFGKPAADELGPIMIHESLANCLIQGQSGNPMKMNSICTRIYEKGEVELDDQDFEFLKSAIKSNRIGNDLILSAALSEIEIQTK